MELYAAGTKNWRKTEPKGVLALYPGYEILKIHEPKRPFAFEIKTVDHAYRLAAHSEDELNQWILILERESIGECNIIAPFVIVHFTTSALTSSPFFKCHFDHSSVPLEGRYRADYTEKNYLTLIFIV